MSAAATPSARCEDTVVGIGTDVARHLFCIGRSVGTQFHEAWLATATDDYLAEWHVDRATVMA
jgi:hypothetical protein